MKPEHAHWCKCAACEFNMAHRHKEGAPCLNGKVLAKEHHNCTAGCVTEFEHCSSLGAGHRTCASQLAAGDGPLMEAGCEPGCSIPASSSASRAHATAFLDLLVGV